MYIALNRFRIIPNRHADFEKIWRNRETHLEKVPGFLSFNLIKGKQQRTILFMPLIRHGKVSRTS